MWIKDWLRWLLDQGIWKPVAIYWCDIDADDELTTEIEHWCRQSCQGHWKMLMVQSNVDASEWCEGIAFSRKTDAVLFKLFHSDRGFIFDETSVDELGAKYQKIH